MTVCCSSSGSNRLTGQDRTGQGRVGQLSLTAKNTSPPLAPAPVCIAATDTRWMPVKYHKEGMDHKDRRE